MNYKVYIYGIRCATTAPFSSRKTYDIIDGKIVDDNGETRTWTDSNACLAWLRRYYHVCVISKVPGYPSFEEDDELEYDEERFVITREGKSKVIVTKFLGDKEVDSVEIGCTNANAFNFTEGAIFALKELQKRENRPPAVYNGRVVCTSDYAEFKRGMVYDVKDGRIISAPGLSIINISSFEDLDDRFPDCKFIELVG